MGKTNIPRSVHREIRRSAAVAAHCRDIAERVAAEASSISGVDDGYSVTEGMGATRVRYWVRPQKPEAYRAETKSAVLAQADMRVT